MGLHELMAGVAAFVAAVCSLVMHTRLREAVLVHRKRVLGIDFGR